MCQVRDEVKQYVKALVDEGKMFTAFDVTKLLRQNGHVVRHSDIRADVYAEYSNGDMGLDYVKTRHEIDNGVWAIVFHEYRDDYTQYDPNADLSSVVSTDQEVDTVEDDEDEGEESDVNTVTMTDSEGFSYATLFLCADKRGRICILAEFIKNMGLKSGDKVGLTVENDMLTLAPINNLQIVHYCYTVDKDYNVRISRKILKESDIGNKATCIAHSDKVELIS